MDDKQRKKQILKNSFTAKMKKTREVTQILKKCSIWNKIKTR